jgi:hypothetical protein
MRRCLLSTFHGRPITLSPKLQSNNAYVQTLSSTASKSLHDSSIMPRLDHLSHDPNSIHQLMLTAPPALPYFPLYSQSSPITLSMTSPFPTLSMMFPFPLPMSSSSVTMLLLPKRRIIHQIPRERHRRNPKSRESPLKPVEACEGACVAPCFAVTLLELERWRRREEGAQEGGRKEK